VKGNDLHGGHGLHVSRYPSQLVSVLWPAPYSVTHLPNGLAFSSQTFSHMIPQHFSDLVQSTHTYLPMKMERAERSETSAYKLQTPDVHAGTNFVYLFNI